MAVVDFPNIIPENMTWGLVANTKAFTSQLNQSVQTGELPGSKWISTLTFTNRFGREARALRGFLAGLNGMAGRFRLSPEDSESIGTALGTGTVNGTGQTGSTLVTDGWDAGQPLLFAIGDYFEVNGELKMITADISSDGSGNATLQFAPPLRKPVSDGNQIVTDNPKVTMMLSSNDQSQWDVTSPIIYAMSISCEEALDI